MDLRQLAQQYGTPLYVYDFDHFTAQYDRLKEAFRGHKSLICYAQKANSNLSVIRHFGQLGSGADCVSIGEVERAFAVGINKYKIIFSGIGKRDDEIVSALQRDILLINVESEAEFERVEMLARDLGVKARISIRVNPNIDPQTHPYISTGLSKNKFGVDLESAKRLYLRAHTSPSLDPVGIHFHIGSQLTQLDPIRESAAIVSDVVRSLKAAKIDLKFFDIGGGIGIRYEDEETIDPYDYIQAVMSSLSGLDMTIMTEPGRFLVGNGGTFLTKVLYEKTNGDKRFVIVDGAMNDLVRPSLYDAYHRVEVLGGEGEERLCDVVGPVCESGDFLAKDRPLPMTQAGDILAVHSAGAYGFTMSSQYNTRPRAAEVAIENGVDRLIRRRETIEDLLALEKECL